MLSEKLPISVAMVVYNEEKLIRRALESCADLIDDIVIVHDGPCKDRTLEIAKEFTDKIYVLEHVGAPEPHRPFSFAHTKHNWVLQLDADEYLDVDFQRELPNLIHKNTPGYTVNWIEDTSKGKFLNMTKEVLFQKDRIYFIGAPCEYVKPVNKDHKLSHANVGVVNSAKINNYDNWKIYKEKYSKLRNIQAVIYARPFSELSTWNYQAKTWDRNNKLKIQHPILLGIVGMNFKFAFELLRKTFGQKTPSSLASITHQIWYNSTLYWRLHAIKNKKNHSKPYSSHSF